MLTKNKNIIKAILLMTSSLTVMAGATIAPSLPGISEVFKDTPQAEFLSKLVLTLPALMIAIVSPIVGYIIDKFGRLKLLFISLVLYAIGGTTGMYLNDLYGVLAGRALLGVAVAGVMTTSTTLIADYLQGPERNKLMGLQGAFMALGGMVFVGAGGFLADVSWRYPFALYFFPLLILPLAIRFLFEPEIKKELQDDRLKEKVIYPSFLVNFIYLVAFAGMIMYYVVAVQLPFLLKEIGVLQNAKTGYAMAISTFMGAMASFNYRRFKDRFSFVQMFVFAFGFMGAGFCVIGSTQSYAIILVGMAIGGLGIGFLLPNPSLWIMSLAPEKIRGRLLGGLTMAVFLGQFFSPIASQPVATQWSLSMVFLAGGVSMLVMAIGFIVSNKYLMGRDEKWQKKVEISTSVS